MRNAVESVSLPPLVKSVRYVLTILARRTGALALPASCAVRSAERASIVTLLQGRKR